MISVGGAAVAASSNLPHPFENNSFLGAWRRVAIEGIHESTSETQVRSRQTLMSGVLQLNVIRFMSSVFVGCISCCIYRSLLPIMLDSQLSERLSHAPEIQSS